MRFRGSLGSRLEGREAFKGYVEQVRAAFPDWHNRIDELIDAGDTIVARMTYSGTHRGPLLGVIREAWVVGDTQELWRALGRL